MSNLCSIFLQTASAMVGYVIWPPPGPRTYSEYDCEEGRAYHNLRSVKWGPKGGKWEEEFVVVVGPPMEERRPGMGCCWLCNTELKAHPRQWTRPVWTRNVGWGRRVPQLPYERARVYPPRDPSAPRVTYHSTKEEPPSQLDMTIFSCPNGCDADDTLQPLLDQKDHTGPERGPWR